MRTFDPNVELSSADYVYSAQSSAISPCCKVDIEYRKCHHLTIEPFVDISFPAIFEVSDLSAALRNFDVADVLGCVALWQGVVMYLLYIPTSLPTLRLHRLHANLSQRSCFHTTLTVLDICNLDLTAHKHKRSHGLRSARRRRPSRRIKHYEW